MGKDGLPHTGTKIVSRLFFTHLHHVQNNDLISRKAPLLANPASTRRRHVTSMRSFSCCLPKRASHCTPPMITFRGFSVSIRAEKDDLPVFQPEFDEETNTATCWIPSQAGKEFSLWARNDNKPPESRIRSRIEGFVDGSEKAAFRFSLTAEQNEQFASEVRVGEFERSTIRFTELRTSGMWSATFPLVWLAHSRSG